MRISADFLQGTENLVHENEPLNYFVIGANSFHPRLSVFYSFFDEIAVVPEPQNCKKSNTEKISISNIFSAISVYSVATIF